MICGSGGYCFSFRGKKSAFFRSDYIFWRCFSVINAENAAHRSEKFATMATRTRQEYLKDLANNYTVTTLVKSGQKFCKYL